MINDFVKRIVLKFLHVVRFVYYRPKFLKIGFHTTIAWKNRISGFKHIWIGDYCSLGTNLRLEAIVMYANERYCPQLIIEDGVWINQNFHCTCAEKVKIGGGTSITANVGIFDIIHPYQNISENPRDAKIETRPVVIGEECLIGMNSVILPGTKLGKHCIVGANSTVSGEYPDYCVIAGSPARIVKKYDFENKVWIKV